MHDGAESGGVSDALEKSNLPQGRPVTAVANRDESASSDDNAEGMAVNPRKQQTKKKKKNRKAQRREDTTTSSPFDASELSAALPSTLEEPKVSGVPGTSPITALVGSAASTSDSRKSCNTCGGSFDSAATYRAHFKSDWHRFNQKLTLKGAAPISEQEFNLVDSDSFSRGADDSILGPP
jgi:hypothetical protein